MKPDEPMGLETRGFHLGMLGVDGIRPTRCIANGEWHPLSSSAVIPPQSAAELAWENSCLGVDRAISKGVLLRCCPRTNSRTLCGLGCMWLAAASQTGSAPLDCCRRGPLTNT